MRRFRGAPSEVVIMPYPYKNLELNVGVDMTFVFGVTKYHKPVPANLQGKAKGPFPDFIPKTDEPNYQSNPELVDSLHGKPFYITEKVDGSSSTAYRYKDEFGVCSRNWELEEDLNVGYWEVANRYDLKDYLPEGYAIQWETCGPKIQSNPLGLPRIEGYAFSVYNIHEHRYLDGREFIDFCEKLAFPTVRIVEKGESFDKSSVETLGDGNYPNGKPREGVVVRSRENHGHGPISFKVINLDYEK
jgi:RNA ligase (TIGR02306 family)